MSTLIASLSTGKGTWVPVIKLMNSGSFDKVFLVTNSWTKENFRNEKDAEMIVIDPNKPVEELTQDVIKSLEGKIPDIEVGLNLYSGSGAEHMAILSALLKMGVGIRLVNFEKESVVEV